MQAINFSNQLHSKNATLKLKEMHTMIHPYDALEIKIIFNCLLE